MAWILILTLCTGALSHDDSIALTSVEFTTQDKCDAAGKAATAKFDTMMKNTKYVCVPK